MHTYTFCEYLIIFVCTLAKDKMKWLPPDTIDSWSKALTAAEDRLVLAKITLLRVDAEGFICNV